MRPDGLALRVLPPEVPAEARQRCPDPVPIPDRAITDRETTELWMRDRVALAECERRRDLAVQAVTPQTQASP